MPNLEQPTAEPTRCREIRPGNIDPEGRCVLYWMQRSQRGRDNQALNRAIEIGARLRLPVLAAFGLTAGYPGAQRRHFRSLAEGLVDAKADLHERGVGLVVRLGSPAEVIPEIVRETRPAILVGDENPVRVGAAWRDEVARTLAIPMELVDSDVVIPTSHFPKQEYAARTIRPKIHRLLDEYLKPIPNPNATRPWNRSDTPTGLDVSPDSLMDALRVGGVSEVAGYTGGTREAMRRLNRFLDERLPSYATRRNEPTPYMTSELSAHLHFGQIGPMTIALAVKASGASRGDIDVFLEELIVRRELAINYVARNPEYDRLQGCPDWALRTLAKHQGDRREHVYSATRLENAETHDPLWNAAQKEMVLTGRMHNYLRMYWAKKILHWSPDAEAAFEIALDLNDRYEMDGRDPNGYVGVAWAIGGTHDRPWPERPIFGTVRTMSYESTRRKFDSRSYIRWVDELDASAGPGRLFR